MTRIFGLRVLAALMTFGLSGPAMAETICLRKPPEAQASLSAKAPSFGAVVLAQDAAAYAAKGFAVVPCPSAETQAQYRETICVAAERGNSSVQAQLERQIGEKPAKICAAARAAVTFPLKLPAAASPTADTAPSKN